MYCTVSCLRLDASFTNIYWKLKSDREKYMYKVVLSNLSKWTLDED